MKTFITVLIALSGVLSVASQYDRGFDGFDLGRKFGYGRGGGYGGREYDREPSSSCPALVKKADFCKEIPGARREDNRADRIAATFAWKLFKSTNNPSDFAISPLSPQILLSYLAWASNGTSRKELTKANGFGSPNSIERLVEDMKKNQYNQQPKDIEISTAFFIADDMKINSAFTARAAEKVDIEKVDFSSASAVESFNKWVNEKSKGSMTFDGNFQSNTRMVLASSIYFNAKWQFEFPPPVPMPFKTPKGLKDVLSMSHQDRKFNYGKIEGYAEWLAIPYKGDDSMVIILPNENISVDDLINHIDERAFVDLMYSVTSDDNEAQVNLTIPKFKLETSSSLVGPLQKLGVMKLFSSNAELSYLTPEIVSVSEVKQQTSLDVNEKGSILFSVTRINVVALTVQRRLEKVSFVVDRPFIAMIVNSNEKVPYVIAKVSDPTY